MLDWIESADPESEDLRGMLEYEQTHRVRDEILLECTERIDRLEGGQGPR